MVTEECPAEKSSSSHFSLIGVCFRLDTAVLGYETDGLDESFLSIAVPFETSLASHAENVDAR